MENDTNYKFMKYTIFALFAFWLINCKSNAQSTYGKYDERTTCYEKSLVDSQIKSNEKTINLLKYQQGNNSLFTSQGSIMRSRLQAAVNSKENENFRLNQKMFALTDSKVINDKERLNAFRRQYPLYKSSPSDGTFRGSYRVSKTLNEFNSAQGQAVFSPDLK
jgi:hypothetical protein